MKKNEIENEKKDKTRFGPNLSSGPTQLRAAHPPHQPSRALLLTSLTCGPRLQPTAGPPVICCCVYACCGFVSGSRGPSVGRYPVSPSMTATMSDFRAAPPGSLGLLRFAWEIKQELAGHLAHPMTGCSTPLYFELELSSARFSYHTDYGGRQICSHPDSRQRRALRCRLGTTLGHQGGAQGRAKSGGWLVEVKSLAGLRRLLPPVGGPHRHSNPR
jgi:hypothetical protein